MELIKHTNLIYEYQNFVTDQECSEIVEWLNPKLLKYKNDLDKIKNKTRHNTALDVTHLSPKDIDLKLYKKSHAIIENGHISYINQNKFINYITRNNYYSKQLSGTLHFRSYHTLDYYDWHIDASSGERSQLVYSFILYLNDNFEGGNTFFLNDKIKIKPKIGSLLCFPCDLHHAHKSSKILSGQKHILWCCLAKHF
jgi:hypothetical protein